MPTSGTHITVVQRLAADAKYRPFLGDPSSDLQQGTPDHPDAIKMRCACLGAVGPDIFYLMADYGSDVQDFENFLVKTLGTFECVGELIGKLTRYVKGELNVLSSGVTDELFRTFSILSALMTGGLEALVVNAGYNFWPAFEPARQQDRPREQWYWADYFHYIRTGRFAQAIVDEAYRSPVGNRPFLQAYAHGYLTHYVTDVIGHPYVNQVVMSPWRHYWQRHHLVENFIDAYVWDRWHLSNPPPVQPSTEEQPLDTVLTSPNPTIGVGAPYTFSRLNDWTNIGTMAFDDLQPKVDAICKKIEKNLLRLDIVEDLEPAGQPDSLVVDWSKMMTRAIAAAYPIGGRHPTNLSHGALPAGQGQRRPNGYPLPEDVIAAYSVFRFVIKMTTEDSLTEPEPPQISQDVQQTMDQFLQELKNDLGSTPAPTPNSSGQFSLSSLLDALAAFFSSVAKAAAAVWKAVVKLVKAAIKSGGSVVTDEIKYLLYLANKALYAMYRSFRDVLMLNAYSAPFTDQLAVQLGPLDTQTLWQSRGNLGEYPIEEIKVETLFSKSSYHPVQRPAARVEQPFVQFAAPFRPTLDANGNPVPARPDEFLDPPVKDELFAPSGPTPGPTNQGPLAAATVNNVPSFEQIERDFGGAVANSAKAIDLLVRPLAGQPLFLPDYNLDGDRGYAWPCWDVEADKRPGKPDAAGKFTPSKDPLEPWHNQTGVAEVRAVAVTE